MASSLQVTRTVLKQRGLKFAAVSVISTACNQVLLFGFISLAEKGGGSQQWWVPANIVAVLLSSIPSVYLSKRWVWAHKTSGLNFRKEVVPFMLFGLAGLTLSSFLVWVASGVTGAPIVANAANLAAFGSLWVVKLVVLDRKVFDKTVDSVELVDE